MSLVVACPRCRQRMRVDPAHAGRRVKCPGCEVVLQVPVVTGPTASPPHPGTPNQAAGLRRPPPSSRPRAPGDDDSYRLAPLDEPPRPRSPAPAPVATPQPSVARPPVPASSQQTPPLETLGHSPSADGRSVAAQFSPMAEPNLDELFPSDLPPEVPAAATGRAARPLRTRKSMPPIRSKTKVSLDFKLTPMTVVALSLAGLVFLDFAFFLLTAIASPQTLVDASESVVKGHLFGTIPLLIIALIWTSVIAESEGPTQAWLCRKIPVYALFFMVTRLPKTLLPLCFLVLAGATALAGVISVQIARSML